MPLLRVTYNSGMKLEFTKMHGAGNDFVVLDGYSKPLSLNGASGARARGPALRRRRGSVAAGRKTTDMDGVDFRYRIFNCDGGEVEHCGNGARCFVKFVRDRGLTSKTSVRVQVHNGVIEPTMQENGDVVVDMGAPVFEPARVPFDAEGLQGRTEGADTLWPLDVHGETRWISVVSMGNPHAVQIVADVENAPVLTEGPVIEHHARFPKPGQRGLHADRGPRCREAARVRTWRGRNAGVWHWRMRGGRGGHPARSARLAGAGADARRQADHRVGRRAQGAPLFMAGPATTVFEGEIELVRLLARASAPPISRRAIGRGSTRHVASNRPTKGQRGADETPDKRAFTPTELMTDAPPERRP